MIRQTIAVYFSMCTNIADVWVTVIIVLALYILFVMYNQVSIQLQFPLEAFATFQLKAYKASYFKVYFMMGFQLALENETMTTVCILIHVSRFCLCLRCTRVGMYGDPDVVLPRWAFWVQVT